MRLSCSPGPAAGEGDWDGESGEEGGPGLYLECFLFSLFFSFLSFLSFFGPWGGRVEGGDTPL